MLVLFAVLATLLVACAPARSDLPTFTDNGNASRTLTWNMTDPTTGLQSVDNVTMTGGRAQLPWQSASIAWNRSSDFTANGTLAPGMAANATGVSLWGNTSSHVADGSFSAEGTWTYTNGTTKNVTARWNATQKDAELQHLSSSDEVLKAGFDGALSGWTLSPPLGTMVPVHGGQKQGTGMMGIDATSWTSGSSSYLGALNLSGTPIDWSAYNRLTVWIEINESLPVGFNVTANLGLTGKLLGTVNQSLVPGWQEVAVNLDQLGPPADRSQLTQLTLRFNGPGVPSGTWFFVDDLRVGVAKAFGEQASASQTFTKVNATTPLPGSARLAFDWSLGNASLGNTTGLVNYTAAVSLGGPGGTGYRAVLGPATPGVWGEFSTDVSSSTAPAGLYNLSFRLWVQGNTTGGANVTVYVDNVSLVFPDRQNGTYVSDVLSMGTDSAYLSLSWSASVPGFTNLTFGLRSGNTSNPNGGGWSSWQVFGGPGTFPVTVPGGVYFQARAVFGSTNVSRTPLLQSFSLSSRHHVYSGSLVSLLYPALGDFLSWSSFNASIAEPPLTGVAFYVGNGTGWSLVTPGAPLTSIVGTWVQWKAVLSSSDGLVSPSIQNVQITYQYQGKPVRVVVFQNGRAVPAGSTVNVSLGNYTPFTAVVYDAGSHVLPVTVAPLTWQSTDTRGGVFPNGTYYAGSLGLHEITVTVSGYSVYTQFSVNVVGQVVQPPASLWAYWPLYLIALGALAGFGVYEFVIRRMYAIDDVFLIAKDGRLIVHNTRRMRADRDEDILSGMLTAIMAFLRDQDPEENGEFKKFQVGGKTTLLERGQHVYLTAVYSGRVPRWAVKDLHRFMTDLEDHFGDAFAHWSGSPEDLHGLREFMGHFVSHVRYHRARGRTDRAS